MFDASSAVAAPLVEAGPGPSSSRQSCPICHAPFQKRAHNQVTCGQKTCSREYATRNRGLFRKTAVPHPCDVCGTPFTPRSPRQRFCGQKGPDGKLTPCAKKGQQICWYRSALDPDVAEGYGVKLATVRATLTRLLADVHNPSAFAVEPPGGRTRSRESLTNAPVIGLTPEGESIFATANGGEVVGQLCEICGDAFAGKPGACGKGDCRKERRRRYADAWYKTNKAHHVAATMAARKRRREAVAGAPVDASPLPLSHGAAPTVTPAPSSAPVEADPWMLPAPPFGPHLPAIAVPLTLTPPRALTLAQVNPLHGALTQALDRPHTNVADWSLSFADHAVSPSCVVACFRSGEDVARLRSQPWPLRLGRERHVVTVGRPWTAKLKTPPAPPPGRYRVRLDTVTPVVIKHSVRREGERDHRSNVHHQRPTAWNLISTLASTLAPRLGISVLREEVAVEILRAHAEPTRDVLRGTGSKIRMHAAGWEGHLELQVNAVALWLLRCAARGMGLGGRVAFGFGQIRLTEGKRDGAGADAVAAPVEVLRHRPQRPLATTAMGRDVVEVFAESGLPPQRVKARGTRPPRPEPTAPPPAPTPPPRPTVGIHAVRRYAKDVMGMERFPTAPSAQARLRADLEVLVALASPHRAYQAKPDRCHLHLRDPWEWLGPRLARHDGARLRLVVGRSTEPATLGDLVVATVLPPSNEAP
jgi:hypothetical protein